MSPDYSSLSERATKLFALGLVLGAILAWLVALAMARA